MTGSSQTPYLVELNPGYFEYQLPISVKAVILWRDRIPLLKNERDEWELPGGKLEVDESPETTLAREVREELGWDAEVGEPLHSWVYKIRPNRHVFVLAFRATYSGTKEPAYSHEHKELSLVRLDEVDALNMPQDYKTAIALATAPRSRPAH